MGGGSYRRISINVDTHLSKTIIMQTKSCRIMIQTNSNVRIVQCKVKLPCCLEIHKVTHKEE